MIRTFVISVLLVFSVVLVPGAAASAHKGPPNAPAFDYINESGYREYYDVHYGKHKRNQMDIYVPTTKSRKRVLVVLIHGGSFKWGDKSHMALYQHWFAQRGWVAATINYRLKKGDSYRPCRDDVFKAIKYLRRRAKRYGIDTSRVAVVGSSAGGNLAALSATVGEGSDEEGSRVKAAVTWSAPVFMGDSYMTPYDHVDATDAPIRAFVSTNEIVPVNDARYLQMALEAAGVEKSELTEYPGSRHAQELLVDAWLPSVTWLGERMGGYPRPDPAIGK